MPIHPVKQGECLSSIADRYGFFWETLWNLPENQELRSLRLNPNVLQPGDRVFIPEKRTKELPCSTGREHVFRCKGIPAKLILRLVEFDSSPRAGIPYSVFIDGEEKTGTTSSEGLIQHVIAPNAKQARLILHTGDGDEEYELSLGHLNPIEVPSGVQARLLNLGFYDGEFTNKYDAATRDAIRRFQEVVGLPVTGEADEATRKELVGRHGS